MALARRWREGCVVPDLTVEDLLGVHVLVGSSSFGNRNERGRTVVRSGVAFSLGIFSVSHCGCTNSCLLCLMRLAQSARANIVSRPFEKMHILQEHARSKTQIYTNT